MIEFVNDDEDQDMQYDCVVKYADKDAFFWNFKLPVNPIPPPEEAATHNNETFVMADKLDWTKIFKDANHAAIPDMTPIPFIGEREELDLDIIDEEINSMKDSNGTIRFMNIM